MTTPPQGPNDPYQQPGWQQQPGYQQQGYQQPGWQQPPGYGQYPAYGQYPGYSPPPSRGTNGMAIGALVTAIAGFLFCAGLISPIAIILGNKALDEIKVSGEEGDGMARAGIIIGWIALGLIVVAILIIVIAVIIAVAAA